MSRKVLQKNLFRPRSVYTLAVKLFVNTTIMVKWSICWSRSKYVFPLLPDTVLIKTSFYGRSCWWWVPSRVAELCSCWAEQRQLLCSKGTWGVWSSSLLPSELPSTKSELVVEKLAKKQLEFLQKSQIFHFWYFQSPLFQLLHDARWLLNSILE